MHATQFSIATLLVVTLLAAVYLVISRFEFLLVPLAFPFTLGPIAAYRVNRTTYSLFVGTLFSSLCSLIGIGPYLLANYLIVFLIGWIDERLLTRSLFDFATIAYFIGVSIIGGYFGGIAAGPD